MSAQPPPWGLEPAASNAAISPASTMQAALLKFLDNIARVYAAAVSMMVVLVASWPLFGVPISPQVAISIITVVLSMVQYHLPPSFDQNFDRGVH